MILFIILSIILFFFCLYLYQANKNLQQQVTKLESETKEILERKIMKSIATDLVSIETLSKDSPITISSSPQSESSNNPKKNHDNPPKMTHSTIPKHPTNIPISNLEAVKPITSEKTIIKETPQQGFNLSDFIPGEKRVLPNLKEEKILPSRNNSPSISANEYLKEISEQIAAQLEPKTIELTDYEKNEEEQAVISYQELLSLKGNLPKEEQSEDLNEYINLLD